jgi:hypothetical protein
MAGSLKIAKARIIANFRFSGSLKACAAAFRLLFCRLPARLFFRHCRAEAAAPVCARTPACRQKQSAGSLKTAFAP